MFTHDQATTLLLRELEGRGFVKLDDKGELRGLTEADLQKTNKLEALIDEELVKKIKAVGHFESGSLNRFADLYYLSPKVSGKTIELPELDRLERIDSYDLVVADFKGFCLYIEDVLKIVE
ncbi:MAG: hypothetical protein ABFQ95_03380 [Pseudomonadota bacterium]